MEKWALSAGIQSYILGRQMSTRPKNTFHQSVAPDLLETGAKIRRRMGVYGLIIDDTYAWLPVVYPRYQIWKMTFHGVLYVNCLITMARSNLPVVSWLINNICSHLLSGTAASKVRRACSGGTDLFDSFVLFKYGWDGSPFLRIGSSQKAPELRRSCAFWTGF